MKVKCLLLGALAVALNGMAEPTPTPEDEIFFTIGAGAIEYIPDHCYLTEPCIEEIRRIVREEMATSTPTVTPTPTITPNPELGMTIRAYPFCSVGEGWESHTMEGRGVTIDGVYFSTWDEFHMAGPGKGCREMVYITFTPTPTPGGDATDPPPGIIFRRLQW